MKYSKKISKCVTQSSSSIKSMFDSIWFQTVTRFSRTDYSDSKVYRNNQGFSLIELLVVISIMSILMALAAVSYTTAQLKGRDAKRRADMENIQKGFEQYFASTNSYDSVSGCSTIGASTSQFPAGLPRDPKNAAPYTYSYTCSTSAYCVCARLETTGGGNSTAASSAVTCSFASSGSTNYFCVTNLQ